MRGFKYVLLAAAALLFVAPMAAKAEPVAAPQLSIGIGIGAEPSCPYGYYGFGSYQCAPYGYYGPEWFSGGRFIGAGRWGRPGFYGHVNRAYDPRYGYHGGFPHRGGYQEHPDHFHSFHGSHYSDGGGHYHTEAQHGSFTHGGGGHDHH